MWNVQVNYPFFRTKKKTQKFDSFTTNQMEKMVKVKNVNDNAIRKGEQGNPGIFPRKKLDTNEKHFKWKSELWGVEENLCLIAVRLLSWG